MKALKVLAVAMIMMASSIFAVAPADAAPIACFKIYSSSVRLHYVQFVNECSVGQRRKVIIDWGPDSDCITLSPGQSWYWAYPLGSYSHTVGC